MITYKCTVVEHKCNDEDCALAYASGRSGTIVVKDHDELIHAKSEKTFIVSFINENEDMIINKMWLRNFHVL